jgi:four helix bundle protein
MKVSEDPLDNYVVYTKASELYEKVLDDTNILMRDIRGYEITKQLVRSAGSICANIEEGFGRGYKKEFIRYLRISRGSARETRGWYKRSRRFLDANITNDRIERLNVIISILVAMINTMEDHTK